MKGRETEKEEETERKGFVSKLDECQRRINSILTLTGTVETVTRGGTGETA